MSDKDLNINKQPKNRNIVLMVMAVAGIPLICIGLVVSQQLNDTYGKKVTDHLSTLVRKHSRTINGFLFERLGNIRFLARSHPVEQLADSAFLTNKLAILREEYNGVFVDLGLVDPEGVQQAYSGPFNLARADYKGAAWFSEAQKNQYFISDVFTGLRGTPHFIVAVKIPWQNEGWILRATVDFNTFNAIVSNIKIGTTGFAYILNREAELQTNPRLDELVARPPVLGIFSSSLKSDEVLISQHPDALGQSSIFAVIPLNNDRWMLCYQQTVDDAFAEWNETEKTALFLFIVWAMVVAVFTYFISFRMTTRLKEVTKQKDKMSDQVIEAGRLASIGELAAGIAHEINNPVAIMVEESGWIRDLLEEDDPTNSENMAEIQRAAVQIGTQGARCKEITHKLLSFARKTDPTVKEIDLNAMAEEMVGLMGQKTRYANVQIETDLDSELPTIFASATELQQVLLNLLNNSVDAFDSSGGLIKISTRYEDGHVLLSVADNGVGIAEANLQRIFDPFYTTKPVGQGTGLGLSICYGIIKKLGGDIMAKSAKGKGTTFTISLPVVVEGHETEKNDSEAYDWDSEKQPQNS